MAINITMPALSPTMETGKLAKWLIKEGTFVSSGDVVAEIETDKATMEVEAVDEGILAKILIPDGTEAVAVNSVIAILAEEGEDPAKIADEGHTLVTSSGDTPLTSDPRDEGNQIPVSEASRPQQTVPPSSAPSLADNMPDKKAIKNSEKRPFSSPLARRIAAQNKIDLSTISGSGPHGRIVKRDVESALITSPREGASKSDVLSSALPPIESQSDEQILSLFEENSYSLIAHDGMRKTIARRLVESKNTVPHFYLSVDCALDTLLELRRQMNESAPEINQRPVYKISVNDFVIKALGNSLKIVPEANVSWTSTHMIQHKRADIGVAVAIPGGLITPVIRNVENQTLSKISNTLKELAVRARARKLLPHEYQGGSSAVSNLGMYGVKNFCAVINPPQATILAVGAGEQCAIVRNGAVTCATMMNVTLSCDHRAVDGAVGAQLLAMFKKFIENPAIMLV